MSQYTQMHILFPITVFEAGVPHPSFPKKHLSQGHYGTSHTAYHTKWTNLQSNYNVKEINVLRKKRHCTDSSNKYTFIFSIMTF